MCRTVLRRTWRSSGASSGSLRPRTSVRLVQPKPASTSATESYRRPSSPARCRGPTQYADGTQPGAGGSVGKSGCRCASRGWGGWGLMPPAVRATGWRCRAGACGGLGWQMAGLPRLALTGQSTELPKGAASSL